MGDRRSFRPKNRQLSFLGFVGLFLFFLVIGSIFMIGIEERELEKEEVRVRGPILVKDVYKDIRYVKSTHSMAKMVFQSPNKIYYNETTFKECSEDPSFFRMYVDPICVTLWMYKLQWDPIIFIDNIVGAMTLAAEKEDPDARDKAMSNGGVRTYLQDAHTKGYWKPCTLDTGHRETYIAEIVSFWLDRLLGFTHTPPVVPRYLNRKQMVDLALHAEEATNRKDPEAMRKLNSFLDICGSPRANKTLGIESLGVEGAHVGWSIHSLVGLNTKKKRANAFIRFADIETEEDMLDVQEEWFNVFPDSPVEERRIAMEIMAIHMYAMLVGNLKKFDHNLFKAVQPEDQNGPFIYIDNDRSQWKRRAEKLGTLREINPMAHFCKFPARIAHRILLFRSENRANNGGFSIGSAILSMGDHIFNDVIHNGPLFSKQESYTLNKNIDYLAAMIDECVFLHGVENVFIPEPWVQTDDFMTVNDALVLLNKGSE